MSRPAELFYPMTPRNTVGTTASIPTQAARHRVLARRVAGTLALAAALPGATTQAQGAPPLPAHSAHVLSVTDSAHLHYVKAPGASLLEEGAATGGLPGTVKVRLVVGATVTATFTIYTHSGTISGNGSGTLHGAGLYASFGGTMSVSHGTGKYAHARGHGGFYGVLNRDTDALTVQTTGTLSY